MKRTSQKPELILRELEQRVMMDAAPIDIDLLSESEPTVHEDVLDSDHDNLADQLESLELDLATAIEHPHSDSIISISTNVDLVVVDTTVNDYGSLVSQIIESSNSSVKYQFLFVDNDQSGVAAITDSLQSQSFSAVHLISHGSDGILNIGSDVLSKSTIDRYHSQVSQWGSLLRDGGDLVIYGCDVAASEYGRSFVEQISQLSGTDILASDDLTGDSDLGGDWELEFQYGQIETDLLFDNDMPPEWNFILNSLDGQGGSSGNSVAVDANGNYIVVETDPSGLNDEVVATIFNFDGSVRVADIEINAATAGNQNQAVVAVDDFGNFAVAWTSDHGSQSQIYTRLFDAQGNALTGDIQVSSSSDSDYYARDASISMSSSGEFVVAWEGHGAGDDSGVFAQRFDAIGVAQGSNFAVNLDTNFTQGNASVSMNNLGQFVVTWDDYNKIYVQRYSESGNRFLSVDEIDLFGFDYESSVALNDSGQIAVAWTYTYFSNDGVRARTFDFGANSATSGDISVNATTDDDQKAASVAIADNGQFVVSWEGEGPGDDSGIFVREFDSDGSDLTGEILVNSYTTGDQESSSVALTSMSNYVVVYDGAGPSGDGVFVSQYGTANQRPEATDSTLAVIEGGSYEFSASDFGYSDFESDPFTELVIDSLPSTGTLRLNGTGIPTGTIVTLSQITNGELTYDPSVGSYGQNLTSFDFLVNDGNNNSLSPNTLTFDVSPKNTFLFSTGRFYSSGPAELPNWEDSEALAAGGFDFALGTNTVADLSVQFSFESISPSAKIDALHVVQTTQTIGTTNTITLNPGDVLFSTEGNFSDSGSGFSASNNDIIIFRPTNADYSAGTFEHLVDMSSGTMGGGVSIDDFWSLSLVEQDTTIGDVSVSAGDLLYSKKGAAEDNDIYVLHIDEAGENVSDVTETLLVEGDEIGIGEKIHGLELIERDTTIGGVTWDGATVLVSTERDEDNIGDTNLDVDGQDIFALKFTTTTAGPGSASAIADLFFDGSDAGLDHDNDTSLDAIAIFGTADAVNAAPTIGLQSFSVDENSANGTSVGNVVASDDSADVLSYSIVGGTGQTAFEIDSVSGEITVLDVTQLDFEATPSFTLNVEVSDSGGLTSSTTVTVDLNDIDEFVIQGGIFEDVDGDSDYLEESANVTGASVSVFRDANGNDLFDSGDVLVANMTTTGAGYSFGNLVDDVYFVVVDSTTISATQGINAGSGLGDLWAEQTYGSAGSIVFDGANDILTNSGGALYGGRDASISDDASVAATAQHVTRVQVAGSDSADIDFAFSFNVVTNTLAGDSADADVAENRSIQGSLRQFIQNANAIAGDNSMRFVPVEATNASSGTDRWWRVVVTEALPALTDAGTTIDGTAYDAANPTQVINTNVGQLGTGGSVGVQDLTLNQVDKPELEIINDRTVTPIDIGIDIQADSTRIEHIGIHGFGSNTNSSGNIRVGTLGGTAVDNVTVRNNIIGSGVHALIDPALLATDDAISAQANHGPNIAIQNSTGGTIENNVVAFSDRFGIVFEESSNWNVTDNEIAYNGLQSQTTDAIGINANSGNVSVTGNLIRDNQGVGVDTFNSIGGNTIENNTIESNGLGGFETAGIRLFGTGNLVSLNKVVDNAGPGVLVVGDHSNGTTASTANRISQNEYSNNGTISVDLVDGVVSGTENKLGDGINPNDATTSASTGNNGIDRPEIQSVELVGGTTTISGTADPGATVELYLAGGDGIATTFLGTTTANGSGDFSTTLTSIATGQNIVAIAIDSSNNTSEFSDQTRVNTPPNSAGSSTLSVPSDSSVAVSLGNFGYSDVDADPLVYITVETLPAKGTLTLNGTNVVLGQQIVRLDITDGNLVFTPVPGESGNPYTAFDFSANDGFADSNVATIQIEVEATAPVFVSSPTFSINENSTLVGTVNASDSGGAVVYSFGGGIDDARFNIDPNSGVLTFASSPDFETPLGNGFSNAYNIKVVATDIDGLTTVQDIVVNVQDVNESPSANDQVFSVSENAPVGTIVGSAVANDVDNGQALTFNVLSGTGASTFSVDPSTGEITVVDNTLLDHETNGSLSLTIEVTDDGVPALNDVFTVNINVSDINESPNGISIDNSSVSESASNGQVVGTISVADPDDSDTHTFSLMPGSNAAFGIDPNSAQVFVDDHTRLDFESTPSATLNVRVEDASGAYYIDTITLTITDANEAPVAGDDVLAVGEGGTILGLVSDLTANDTDPEGGPFTIQLVRGPNHGTLTTDGVGGFTYIHSGSEAPTDTFEYRVLDSGLLSDVATVTINVTPENDTPIAVDDSATVGFGRGYVIDAATLLANDIDPDGPALTIEIVRGPSIGSVAFDADGNIVYTQGAGFVRVVDFEYRISDGIVNSNNATVTVNVLPFAAPPIDRSASESESETESETESESEFEEENKEENTDLVGVTESNSESSDSEDPSNDDTFFTTNNDIVARDPSGLNEVAANSVELKESANDLALFSFSTSSNTTSKLLNEILVDSPASSTIAGKAVAKLDIEVFAGLFKSLDEAKDDIGDLPLIDMESTAIVAGVGSVLTVGYAMWLAQSGMLMTGVISSLPSWQMIDPLPILEQSKLDENDEEDIGIDDMVDRHHEVVPDEHIDVTAADGTGPSASPQTSANSAAKI